MGWRYKIVVLVKYMETDVSFIFVNWHEHIKDKKLHNLKKFEIVIN